MTNLDKLIETLQNAPTERTACFIVKNVKFPCKYCVVNRICAGSIGGKFEMVCEDGIKQWLESEVEE